MRILFICPCWPGIAEAYNEGIEPNGMPGFYHLVRELIHQGHEVDLYIFTARKVIFLKNKTPSSHWFSKVRIVGVFNLKNYDRFKRILYELELPLRMNCQIEPLVKKNKYDFIYGQGNYASGANRLAKKYKIPFGLRKYGDDFAPLLKQHGILSASLRSPLTAYSYLSSKAFLLGTNDGTKINEIARLFRKKPPYEVYVWNNGFQQNVVEDDTFEAYTRESFVFQFSRFVSVKGQIDTVEAFYRARQKGYTGHLVFGGTPDDQAYFQLVNQRIDTYGLREYVHFLGKITAAQTKYLTRRSLANIASGVNYNLNNVFIETLGYGGIALVRNTPLVDLIITQGINGFLFSDTEECSEIIIDLYKDKYDVRRIRMKAIETCMSKFGSWEDRAIREVDLITRTAAKKQ